MHYIGILETSITTGHDSSEVSARVHKQKVGVEFPVVAQAFFPTSIFYLQFPTSVEKVIEQTIHQFGRILSGDATPT